MVIEKLDFVFPFFVFGYGFIVLFILTHPALVKIAETRIPADVWAQFKSKRVLAWICLYVGGIWSLQNIWFS